MPDRPKHSRGGRTVAVVQARMTSTRLPGKVMVEVLGRPLLSYQLERLARVRSFSQIVVATTVNAADDVVVRCAESLGAGVFRGPEEDVLDRFHGAARAYNADVVARLTADCPLIDPEVADRVVDALEDNDYVSNTLEPRTFPRGLDVEVFTFAALEKAWSEAKSPYEREHVTPYFYNHPGQFRLKAVRGETDLSHYRWTVDTPEDLQLVKEVIEGLYPLNADFLSEDIVRFMVGKPGLFEVNCHVRQKR